MAGAIDFSYIMKELNLTDFATVYLRVVGKRYIRSVRILDITSLRLVSNECRNLNRLEALQGCDTEDRIEIQKPVVYF